MDATITASNMAGGPTGPRQRRKVMICEHVEVAAVASGVRLSWLQIPGVYDLVSKPLSVAGWSSLPFRSRAASRPALPTVW